MRDEFETMFAAGRSPAECAAVTEASGVSRLEVFKGIYTYWGADAFSVAQLEGYGGEYPSRAARAAATVGLAVVILNYPAASYDEVVRFDRLTGISRKVQALARVDRPTEALSFYDRLDPTVLGLKTIDEARARAEIREVRARASHLSSAVVDSIVTHTWGWLFTPDLGFRDGSQSPLPGAEARPIIFDRFTGSAIEIASGSDINLSLSRYEATGWPQQSSRQIDDRP